MKKFIQGILLLIISSAALAVDPYTFLITHYDSTGNFTNRLVAKPDYDSYLFYNTSTNMIGWSFATSLSMASTQISDTSSIGRDLMTASTQSGARSTIGAGTSNFTGAYSDLTGKPTNLSQFTNDTSFVTASTAPVTSVNSATGAVTVTPAGIGAAASSHTHTASNISDSTSAGRSILTAANVAAVNSILGISAQVNSDWSASSGLAQILNKPAKYSGTTNGGGVYAVTYGSAYSTKPHVVFAIEGGTNKDTSLLTSTTTTGFSILVERRTDLAGLLPTYATVSGLTVNVTVTP